MNREVPLAQVLQKKLFMLGTAQPDFFSIFCVDSRIAPDDFPRRIALTPPPGAAQSLRPRFAEH